MNFIILFLTAARDACIPFLIWQTWLLSYAYCLFGLKTGIKKDSKLVQIMIITDWILLIYFDNFKHGYIQALLVCSGSGMLIALRDKIHQK